MNRLPAQKELLLLLFVDRVSASEQDSAQIREGLGDNIAALNRVADNLYTRWLSTLQF